MTLREMAEQAAREALADGRDFGVDMPLYRERFENHVADAIERTAKWFAERAIGHALDLIGEHGAPQSGRQVTELHCAAIATAERGE